MANLLARLGTAIKAASTALTFPGGFYGPAGVPGRFDSGFFPVDANGGILYAGLRDPDVEAIGPAWHNSAISIGMDWIGRNFTQADLIVEHKVGDVWERVPDHPLIALLDDPIPDYPTFDFHTLWMAALLSCLVDGNGYWYKGRDRAGIVRELWPLNHEWITPYRPSPSAPDYLYQYRVPIAGRPDYVEDFAPEDIVHFRWGMPDPRNDLMSVAPLARCLLERMTDTEAGRYKAALLHNRGVPGLVVIYEDMADAPANDLEADKVKAKLDGRFGGRNRGSTAILMGKVRLESHAFDPAKMDLGSLGHVAEARLAAALGVHPMTLGLAVGNTQRTYCLPGDARVWTPSGPRRIDAVVEGDQVWSFVDGRIVSRPVLKSARVGHKVIYEVRTKNRTLRASGNHPVLVRVPGRRRGVGNAERSASYAWKRVDELSLSDWIVQPKSLPDVGGATLPDGRPATADYLKFLGAIVGDGVVVSSGSTKAVQMCIPTSDRAAVPYRELAASVFEGYRQGGTPIVLTELRNCFQFASRRAVEELTDFGFKARAKTKRVPGWIYGLSRPLRLAFLAGLVDTDGTIDRRGALSFAFCNRELVLDVRDLMISVGIQCSNLAYTRLSPDVLPNPGTKEFYENWRFVASSAVQVAEIPFDDPLYRERVESNADRLRPAGFDAAKAGLSSDLGFYGISSIRELDSEDVHDIEVEEGHSFIADGMIVHNSNFKQADAQSWQNGIRPLQGRMAEALYRQLLPDFEADRRDVRVGWDYSRVEALHEDRDAISKRAIAEYLGGLRDQNEGRTMLGLPPVDGGDGRFWAAKNPNEGAALTEAPVAGAKGMTHDGSGRSDRSGRPGIPAPADRDVTGLPDGAGEGLGGPDQGRFHSAVHLPGRLPDLPTDRRPMGAAESPDALAVRVLKRLEARLDADGLDGDRGGLAPSQDGGGGPESAPGQPAWPAEWEADRQPDAADVPDDAGGGPGLAGASTPGGDPGESAGPGPPRPDAGDGAGEADVGLSPGGGGADDRGPGAGDDLGAEPPGQ